MLLSELMNIQRGVTAIIGGGGKTTLMYTLARELERENRVIVTTTTHILAPEHMRVLLSPSLDEVKESVNIGQAVCIGARDGEKLTTSGIDERLLASIADYALIEADGSKRLPLKAHDMHEPVIPPCAKDIILVMGMSALGKSVGESVHRKQILCDICSCTEADTVTAEMAAHLVNAESLHTKVFLNQTDAADAKEVLKLAKLIKMPVYGGSLMKGEWTCLC